MKGKPGRADKPHVNFKVRGNKRLGLEIAKDPIQLDAAIANYYTDVQFSGDASHFNRRTWHDYHEAVDLGRLGEQPDCTVLPLTPLKIATIGVALKEADYRSAKNYMTAMKAEHVMAGFAWTTQLEMAATRFNLSTTRGWAQGARVSPCHLINWRPLISTP